MKQRRRAAGGGGGDRIIVWTSLCIVLVLCAVAMTWRKIYVSLRGSHTHCECTRQPPVWLPEGEGWNTSPANQLGCGSATPPAKTSAVTKNKLFVLHLLISSYKFKIGPTDDVFWQYFGWPPAALANKMGPCRRGLYLLSGDIDKKVIF